MRAEYCALGERSCVSIWSKVKLVQNVLFISIAFTTFVVANTYCHAFLVSAAYRALNILPSQGKKSCLHVVKTQNTENGVTLEDRVTLNTARRST